MLFTRTIRRKMLVGLTLVLVMLTTLAASSVSGLSSYRTMVNELDFNLHEAPRTADLMSASVQLLEPLEHDLPKNPAGFAEFQQREFAEKLENTSDRVQDFHRRLDRLPPTKDALARRPIIEAHLDEIEHRLGRLRELAPLLGDPRLREHAEAKLRREASKIVTTAGRVPDSQAGLHDALVNARRVYRSRFKLVAAASVISGLLFIGLLRCGYRWIFYPVRKLHQGARRVAQGDFDYRVEVGSADDEMAELAEAFNMMTARFQEIARDLDRKVQERSRQLVRSERLANVGFLAAGVAHEINNPLQAIMTAADSLQSRAGEYVKHADEADAKALKTYLAMIERESVRCREITTRLLDFSRGQDAERVRLDLTMIVGEVIALMSHLKKFRDRKIEFDRKRPCYVEANAAETKQVVLNLVSNSLEAMEPGGTLSIGIDDQTDQAVMSFRDDGCGMTPETIESIFEPFYTRRRDGKGTGLGMSISHRIVNDHGGTIDVASEGPGKGSTFSVHLPRKAVQRDAA